MSCLYSRICVLTQRAPLNAEISRGFQVPWRSRSSLRNATERERDTGGNKNIELWENKSAGRRQRRRASSRGDDTVREKTLQARLIILRGRHATCTCHGVATRASVSPLLERRELSSLYLFFFHLEKTRRYPECRNGKIPKHEARTGKSLERLRTMNSGDLNGGGIWWTAIMKRAFFMCFKKISITLSDLGEGENTEELF